MAERQFSAEEKLKAVERELGYRRRVFARRVEAGQMTPQLAANEIAVMESIRADYAERVKAERLL